MGQAHLTGSALINIHSKVPLDTDNIINSFDKSKHSIDFFLIFKYFRCIKIYLINKNNIYFMF